MSRKHNERNAPGLVEDAANFPFLMPVISSLLVLYLALIGPPRRPVASVELDFTAPHVLEPTAYSMPWKEDHMLVATDSFLRCLEKKPAESRRTPNSYTEVCRVSLQGKTRIVRGRNVVLGSTWENNAALVTASNIIYGLTIGADARLLWETTIPRDSGQVLAVQFMSPPGADLIVAVLHGAHSNETLSFLDATNGSVVQFMPSLEPMKVNAGIPDELEPFPVSTFDPHFYSLGKPDTFVLNSGVTSRVINWNPNNKLWYVSASRSISHDSLIRVDIDGDALPEHLNVTFGEKSCVTLSAVKMSLYKDSFHFSNCSANEKHSKRASRVHAVVVGREPFMGGASALPGNLTRTRLDSRGFNLIFYNQDTGDVSKLGPNGKVFWSTQTEAVLDDAMYPRFYAASVMGRNVTIGPFGKSESATDYLVVGRTKLFVLRGEDGKVALVFPLMHPVQKGPMVSRDGSSFSLILENGDVTLFSIKPLREFSPPLALIPVVIIICTFWACIAWSKLDDEQ